MSNTQEYSRTAQSLIPDILAKHGPDLRDYDSIKAIIKETHYRYENNLLSSTELDRFRKQLGNVLTKNTLLGWNFTKPYGYAGDFQIIDMIYQQKVSTDPRYYKWDLFFNDFSAARAVRNRKTFFKNLLLRFSLPHSGTLRVLNIASGPGRDMLEFLNENPDVDVHFTCLELDERAIAYAKNLLRDHLHRVTFIQQNALRFRGRETYDLVWSAGLFEYFNDSIFTRLYRRLTHNVAPGGEMVIGNFHPRNTSRPIMEIVGDWHLHHRTEEQLTALAVQAGVHRKQLRVEQEPEGVNLFLRYHTPV